MAAQSLVMKTLLTGVTVVSQLSCVRSSTFLALHVFSTGMLVLATRDIMLCWWPPWHFNTSTPFIAIHILPKVIRIFTTVFNDV